MHVKAKNPWWVKALPHVIIICELLNDIVKGFGLFNSLVILMWIWIGTMIADNKLIPPYSTKVILLLLVIINIVDVYPTLIILYHWVIKLF